MNLYIKQKLFSIGDKYNVYDANDQLVYDVQSEIFTIGAKIHLNDSFGRELYFIKRRVTFMCAKYEIYRGDILCAEIQQEFRFFKPKLTISSDYGNFEIEGDFFSWDYTIYKDGILFGSVCKKWLAWGDSYELHAPDGSDPAFFSALVIAIDNCLHNENSN